MVTKSCPEGCRGTVGFFPSAGQGERVEGLKEGTSRPTRLGRETRTGAGHRESQP